MLEALIEGAVTTVVGGLVCAAVAKVSRCKANHKFSKGVSYAILLGVVAILIAVAIWAKTN